MDKLGNPSVTLARANDPLQRLRDEFERELAVLRAPGAADRLRDAFRATPQDIAAAINTRPNNE